MRGTAKSVPLVLAALVLAAAPAAAKIRCVKKSGAGACFKTIQQAVDAASAGDTINIYPGTYRGMVNIPFDKPALKLVGKGLRPTSVRIDGSRGSDPGIQSSAGAADITIRNLTVQGTAGPGIYTAGNGVTASKVRVYASGAPCILMSGDDNQVLNVLVRGCGGTGIGVTGLRGLVSGSSVSIAAGEGVMVSGTDPRVVANRISQVATGIMTSGDNAVVRGNRVNRPGSGGIMVGGPPTPMKVVDNTVIDAAGPGIIVSTLGGVGGKSGEVSGNVVSGAMGEGIFVSCASSCDGSTVRGNRASRVVGGSGMRVDGGAAGLEVSGNVASSNGAIGIYLSGTGLKVLDNAVRGNGMGNRGFPALLVSGSAHEVRRNAATDNTGNGIQLDATAYGPVTGNVARGNLGNGIVVGNSSADLVLSGATASGNYLLGILVESGSATTTLQSCTAKANKGWDLCNLGGATVGPSNTIGSTGCP